MCFFFLGEKIVSALLLSGFCESLDERCGARQGDALFEGSNGSETSDWSTLNAIECSSYHWASPLQMFSVGSSTEENKK